MMIPIVMMIPMMMMNINVDAPAPDENTGNERQTSYLLDHLKLRF